LSAQTPGPHIEGERQNAAHVSDSALVEAGLRQYRLALASQAREFRRYPVAARRAGLAGTVEVEIAVSEGKARAGIVRSSGHAALDVAALDMLQKAAARTALPQALHGKSFSVLLPVSFALEE